MPGRPALLLDLPSYLASHVAKLAQQPLRERLAAHGLLLHHFAVLSALAELGPVSQQDLSDGLELDKSHMVKYIDLLEAQGLALRMPWPEDRRRYRISLTAAGERLIADLGAFARASQRAQLDALTDREHDRLRALLEKVLAAHDADRDASSRSAAGR